MLERFVSVHAKVQLLAQAAAGLAKIHSLDIVHRDISLRNVLLREGDALHALISDFGLARSLREQPVQLPAELRLYPIGWMAPVSDAGARICV